MALNSSQFLFGWLYENFFLTNSLPLCYHKSLYNLNTTISDIDTACHMSDSTCVPSLTQHELCKLMTEHMLNIQTYNSCLVCLS